MIARIRRFVRLAISQPQWPQIAVLMAALTISAGFLLTYAMGIGDYGKNLSLNLGAEIVGALVTIFLIAPVLQRLQSAQVRPHPVLDYEWFSHQLAGVTSTVKILDTFSHLFDLPVTRRMLGYLEEAITQREAEVRVLLLHPDSLAVDQRISELGDTVTGQTDLRREILRNLRVLHDFQQRLQGGVRRRFEVRLYTAAAGITVYRWDGKALVSFLTVGRLSGQGLQLEVAVSSPLGQFVEQRFNELWAHGSAMGDYLLLPLTLADHDGDRELSVQFIELDGVVYASSSELVEELAHHREQPLLVYLRGDRAIGYFAETVNRRNTQLLAQLRAEHMEKYDTPGGVMVALTPR